MVIAGIPLPPATVIEVLALPAIPVEVIAPGLVLLPPGTVIQVPEVGAVVIEAPIVVAIPLEVLSQLPVDVAVIVPIAPQPQVAQTPTPRPTAPAVRFPDTGTGPGPILLPTAGASGGLGAPLAGLLTFTSGALALFLGGARLAVGRRRRAALSDGSRCAAAKQTR